MKTYKGARTAHGCLVTVDGAPLDPRHDLRRYSEGNFEWGYDGAGPRQLALALLAEHFGDPTRALDLHRVFVETVVAEFGNDAWTLTGDAIQRAVDQVAIVPMDLATLLNRVRGIR